MTRIKDSYALGMGYSTDQQMPSAAICVNTSNIAYASGEKSTINMGSTQSHAQIKNILGVFNDISTFSDGTASIFAGNIEDSMYTLNFNVYSQVAFPTQILMPAGYGLDALTDYGQGAYSQGLDQFRIICGDYLVNQIHFGAGLFVTFQIEFATMEDKQTFMSSSSSIGFADLFSTSTSVQETITHYSLKGNVNLLGFQNGGNSVELAQIFTNTTNGYYITSCSFSNLTACNQVITGVLDYAANNFPNQMNQTAYGIEGNTSPIGYSFAPYKALGLPPSQSIITPEINQARETLINLNDITDEQDLFISHLLSSWVIKYMDQDTLSDLQNTAANVTYNLGLLQDQNTGGIACYSEPQNCISVAQNIIDNLAIVNTTFIDLFSKAYQLDYVCWEFGPPYVSFSPIINGIAIPVGNQNYVKIQPSGFIEELQIIISDNNLVVNEPNSNIGQFGYGRAFSITLELDGGVVYSGNIKQTLVDNEGMFYIECVGTLIDNPI